jgi:hypothetical protein
MSQIRNRKSLAGLAAAIFFLSVLLFAGSLMAGNGQQKVTICHVPPGNPDNAHEITVGAPAVPAHLAHGDFLGTCECTGEGCGGGSGGA